MPSLRALPLLLLSLPAAAAQAPKDRCDMEAVRSYAGDAPDPRHIEYVEAVVLARSLKLQGKTICDAATMAFTAGGDEAGRLERWVKLGVKEQAKRLTEANALYKTLDERSAAVIETAPPVTQAAKSLGLLDANGKAVDAAAAVETQRRQKAGQLKPAIVSLYQEIPLGDDDEEGKPGPLVKAYETARKELIAHLDKAKKFADPSAPADSLPGVAVDLDFLERMDAKLSDRVEDAVSPADTAVRAFINFVAAGEPMRGSKLCSGDGGTDGCVTVAQWLKALDGDATVTAGIGEDAKKRADGKGPGGADKARAEANRTAAALFPSELNGIVSPGEHEALTTRGWNYQGVDEEGALYKRDHLKEGPVKLHVGKDGSKQYCQDSENGVCFMKNPFGEESSAAVPVAGGGQSKSAAAETGGAAAPEKPEPEPAKKDKADLVDQKELETMARNEQNALVLYADGDCVNDGTGETYRFCPWVTQAFNELSAKHGDKKKTPFRFVRVDVSKGNAKWDAYSRRFFVLAPALVYTEGEVVKAIRGPHFPDLATTRSKMSDFVEALIRNDYKGFVNEKPAQNERVIPPAPPAPACRGGACSQGGQRQPQPQRSVVQSRPVEARPASSGAEVECRLWSNERGCHACRVLKDTGALTLCTSLILNQGQNPSGLIPAAYVNGRGPLVGPDAIAQAIRQAAGR